MIKEINELKEKHGLTDEAVHDIEMLVKKYYSIGYQNGIKDFE
jgi:predicted ATPase